MIDVLDTTALTRQVKSLALDTGFHLVGVSPISLAPEIEGALAHWLEARYEGNMTYMTRDGMKRAHPEEVLPGAKSVICLGLNYYQPPSESPGPGYGRVAAYAYGRDYHKVMDRLLRRFSTGLQHLCGTTISTKNYADTGPILERAFAAQAGLGFIGKNTNLISTLYGSWIFLATVITDLDLEPDHPVEVSCGTCTRCLDACPTKAFPAPYVLDATKCISYHTIESRSAFPPSVTDTLGDWVFGCDICQQVCPFTTFSTPTDVEDFHGSHGAGPWLDLEETLSISDDEAFRQQFQGTPLMRTKREGLQRNARTILASSSPVHG